MKAITTWSKAHTVLTVLILAGAGYAWWKYEKSPKDTTTDTAKANFTGAGLPR